jgi:type IV secretory pathway VirB10-like protein
MKRFIAITAVVVVGLSALASAQSSATKPLADVAKDEEARRKDVRKPAKVYTNGSLRTDISPGVPAPPTPPSAAKPPANASPTNISPGMAVPAAPTGAGKDEAYWSGRMKAERATLDRLQIFADSLQSRINALLTDFVNRDDPAQRAKIETDRKTALAELERVNKELDQQRKKIAALEDEARRAGVPSGWLRPGA